MLAFLVPSFNSLQRRMRKVMKKALFVLLVAALVAPVTLVGQNRDAGNALQDFSRALKSNGVTLSVVLMNDKTVEVLFQAPTKYSMKARARQTTMLYIQCTPDKDVDFTTAFSIEQSGVTLPGTPHNIKNFENAKVSKGSRIDGIVEFAKKIDLYKPFKVTNGKDSVEFRLDDDLVRSLGSSN